MSRDITTSVDGRRLVRVEVTNELTRASKVMFSASLEEPLAWANSKLVRDEAVEAVRAMKKEGSGS